MTNKIIFTVTLVSFALLVFLAGAVTVRYQLPPSALIEQAITGGEAWFEHYSKVTQARTILKNAGKWGRFYWDKSIAYSGYTLISGKHLDSAYLVDMEGATVHSWRMPFNDAWPNPPHVHKSILMLAGMSYTHVFPNGDLLAQYIGEGDTPYGYGIVKISKYSKVLWTYDQNAHHGFYIDPENGDIYTLVQELVPHPIPGFEKLPFPMLVDSVVRLSSDGKELDRLSILDAFKDHYLSLLEQYHNPSLLWDHLHTNSVMKLEKNIASKFPMFEAGQLLISIRNPGIIAVLDLKKRQAVWATTGQWKMQHDAQFLENGNILLFDNHWQVYPKKYSRVLEINPDTLETEWYYAGGLNDTFYTPVSGSVQKLPNDNYLIIDPAKRRIFEITPKGKPAWELIPKSIGIPYITTAKRYSAKELPFLKKP